MTYIFIVFLMWVSPLVHDAIHMMKQIKHEMVVSLWENKHLNIVFQNNKINQIYLMLVKVLESI